MINRIFFYLLVIIFTSCSLVADENSKNRVERRNDEREISLFWTPQTYNNFYIKINADFEYFDTLRDNNLIPIAYQILKYRTNGDTLNIVLKINNRDTIFKYNIESHDSLLFGLSYFEHFVVFNEKEYFWGED
jgi:hypothetical protein